jgi:hypothetical protein
VIDLDGDGEDEVAFFCPACVEREFRPYSKGRTTPGTSLP